MQSNLTSLYTKFIRLRSLFFVAIRRRNRNLEQQLIINTTHAPIELLYLWYNITVNNQYCVTVICLFSLCSRLSSKRKLESIHGWSNPMRGKTTYFQEMILKLRPLSNLLSHLTGMLSIIAGKISREELRQAGKWPKCKKIWRKFSHKWLKINSSH